MTGSRLRGILLGATALAAALLLLAWSQTWYSLALVDTAEVDVTTLDIGGDVAASGLAPLALTLLAVVAALAIAGPVFRRILGVLEALLGITIVAVTVVTMSDPVQSSAAALTDATGISGRDSIDALVESAIGTAWPWIAVVLGGIVVIIGAAVTATAGRWPVSGRKYARTRTAPADGTPTDAIAEWDALTDGDDPTASAR